MNRCLKSDRRLIGVTVAVAVLLSSGVASAVKLVPPTIEPKTPTPTRMSNADDTSNTSGSAAQQAARLSRLKTRANAEINRRLMQLGKLNTLISGTAKLSASDKSALQAEVNTTISRLNVLKTEIDSATDLATALNDAKSIVTEYRVYVLVTPKMHLIAAADAQLQVEAKLTTLAGKLQARITAAQNQGKDVTALQSELTAMDQDILNAQSVSANVEHKVLPLQPGDYNADHTLLSGYRAQLQTAHNDNQSALKTARQIVPGLQNQLPPVEPVV